MTDNIQDGIWSGTGKEYDVVSRRPDGGSSLLPQQYLDNMHSLLRDEYAAFLAEYDKNAYKALRFNTKKVRLDTIEKLKHSWSLEPVEWCSDAYYYVESDEVRPGLSPYHDAGVFYIQEPSAMLTAERADIKETDTVLDLCAAPGGKSTRAAEKCRWLISNEPIPGRARILSSNIERMGYDNVIVSSAYPDQLAAAFSGFFDKIIVDAPCSGEGMMRKDKTAAAEWSPENVKLCIDRQREILDAAASMLKPGGRIIYSTCTFEYGENEGQISEFLSRHPEYALISEETLYPHRANGEGHFCAVLELHENAAADTFPKISKLSKLSELAAYMRKKKLHVLRTGIEYGEYISDKKGNRRYEPSHAEALAGVFGNADSDSIELNDENAALSYLKGNVIDLDMLDASEYALNSKGGWITVMYDGYPLGLGKFSGHVVKNHYPKGLRHV